LNLRYEKEEVVLSVFTYATVNLQSIYIYHSLFTLNLRYEKEEVVALVGQTIRQLRHY